MVEVNEEDSESVADDDADGATWLETAERTSSGKNISAQVKTLLSGQAFQTSKPQLTQDDDGIVEWVRVSCRQHVSSTGIPCQYQYPVELLGDKLVKLG